MALSAKEQTEIVMLLGYSHRAIVEGTTDYSRIIAQRLTTDISTGAEELIRVKLDRLRNLDEKREGALCRLSAKQVDSITLNGDELYMLDKERRRLLGELSDLVDIPLTGSAKGGANIGVCV